MTLSASQRADCQFDGEDPAIHPYRSRHIDLTVRGRPFEGGIKVAAVECGKRRFDELHVLLRHAC